MNRLKQKAMRHERRKIRVRKRVFGTPERPRLSVTRSNKNIGAQLIDDLSGRTLVQAHSQNKDMRGDVQYGGNRDAAAKVGMVLAQRARLQGIKEVAFDRNGYKYHGRIKALADAAREAGLKF